MEFDFDDVEFDPYELLGIRSDATASEIKDAFRKLAKEWHPDRNAHRVKESTEKMQLINRAWSTLEDAETRAAWDAFKTKVSQSGHDHVDQRRYDEWGRTEYGEKAEARAKTYSSMEYEKFVADLEKLAGFATDVASEVVRFQVGFIQQMFSTGCGCVLLLGISMALASIFGLRKGLLIGLPVLLLAFAFWLGYRDLLDTLRRIQDDPRVWYGMRDRLPNRDGSFAEWGTPMMGRRIREDFASKWILAVIVLGIVEAIVVAACK